MLSYIKWIFWITFWVLIGAFLHYTLPQQDVARIVNTDVRRVDFGSNSFFWAGADVGQSAPVVNRDVRFIEAFRTDGKPMIYRNEDTGWGWPPYFKLDSSNLQAEARDLISTKANPQWVVIRHYGWRNEFLSIYPNAVSVRPVASPNVRLIPWFNIVILTLLFALAWAIRVRWKRFRAARIDPLIDDFGDAYDRADARADETRGKIGRWMDSWKSKPRK